ncbi:MAG: hypothetical protein AAGC97_03580 [Planctomycetota bacterium]
MKLAARRGFLQIAVRQREPVGRRLKSAYNKASKEAWRRTGEYFHEHLRDERFTPEHAAKAGYSRRKGEGLPRGSRAFARSYYGRKLRSDAGGGRGKANPLVFSGDTRRNVATQYRVSSTSKGARVTYRGARVLNFKHPKSRIRMTDEFRRLLPDEVTTLARVYDDALDHLLSSQSN